jgi:enoyl reductase-like protein
MGFGMDEIIDFDFCDDTLSCEYWTERNGKTTHISEMKVSHIKNLIRCIETGRLNDRWIDAYGYEWKIALKAELRRREDNKQ